MSYDRTSKQTNRKTDETNRDDYFVNIEIDIFNSHTIGCLNSMLFKNLLFTRNPGFFKHKFYLDLSDTVPHARLIIFKLSHLSQIFL